MSSRPAPVLSTTSGGVLATNRGCIASPTFCRPLWSIFACGYFCVYWVSALVAYSSPYPPLKIDHLERRVGLDAQGVVGGLRAASRRPAVSSFLPDGDARG